MDPIIQQAWEAGLAVLKPSPKDLEHGLELHRESLVCETYGFSPGASLDLQRLLDIIEAGASPVELEDAKEEMMMLRKITEPGDRAEFQEAWKAAGVTCIFQNAGVELPRPEQILKRLARYTHVVDMMPEFLMRATRAEDVSAAKAAGKYCMLFSANAVPMPQHWENTVDELSYIRVFYQLGVRMMHLTYNRRNMLGDGCGEATDGGLSDFGRLAVAEMNRAGVLVDIAHSGPKTGKEAVKASSRPVVASHSGARALWDHIRCKDDETIRAIADSGGYIGIVTLSGFLGGDGNLNAFLDHIDHVAKKFGPDHAAIGTDVCHSNAGYRNAIDKIPSKHRGRPGWEKLWPKGSIGLGAAYSEEARRSLAWTNWPLFTVGMVQRGYRDEDIQKIIGGNMLRVLKAVSPDPARIR